MKKVTVHMRFLCLLLLLCTILCACAGAKSPQPSVDTQPSVVTPSEEAFSLEAVPPYSGTPYAVMHNNMPYFATDDLNPLPFEHYAALDTLGRCGAAVACVGKELMPEEDRGSIGMIKPTGWQLIKYDCVDGKYLYNRCHLLGYQLTGENANECNLITGTRYLNVQGMLPFENEIADYVKSTDNHVFYRVTPVFSGDELLARGVLMEAYSVEDGGAGISFCVFCYNVQPEIEIDYKTGDSVYVGSADTEPSGEVDYILNTNSKRFHRPDCSSAADIAPHNRESHTGDRQSLLDMGYIPCGRCKP